MNDTIIEMGKTVIQHGKLSDRIYLMKLDLDDTDQVLRELEMLATKNRYSKIFAKVPEHAEGSFLNSGYEREAFIPGFYKGREGCCFMGKYFSQERKHCQNKEKIDHIITASQEKSKEAVSAQKTSPFAFRRAEHDDITQMARVYKNVFETYPFPIHQPDYLKMTMDKDVIYFGAWDGNNLIAISSAETNPEEGNAEMTDFAVLPEYRGENLALHLLNLMEHTLPSLDIHMAYTIARSVSFGMNITFAKNHYAFAGTLFNNTNISGSIESMNVWYKKLT